MNSLPNGQGHMRCVDDFCTEGIFCYAVCKDKFSHRTTGKNQHNVCQCTPGASSVKTNNVTAKRSNRMSPNKTVQCAWEVF